MYQLLVESLLGLGRSGNQLRVQPLVPRDWDEFDLHYRFGESTYDIACRRADSASSARVTVDGIAVVGGSITLQSDGKAHAVVVAVWREPQPA